MVAVIELRCLTGAWLAVHGAHAEGIKTPGELLDFVRRAASDAAVDEQPSGSKCDALIHAQRVANGVLVRVDAKLESIVLDGCDDLAMPLWEAVVTRPETLGSQLRSLIYEGDESEVASFGLGPFQLSANKGKLRAAARGCEQVLRLAEFLSTPGEDG